MFDEVEEHEHDYGPVGTARFTGEPRRECRFPGCRMVSLDLDGPDDEEPEGEDDGQRG